MTRYLALALLLLAPLAGSGPAVASANSGADAVPLASEPIRLAAKSPARNRRCSIKVGWDPWEPYQYRDDRGRLEGLDVELVRLIARNARCNVDFVEGNWAELLEQLQRGEVDLLTGASRTEAREAYAWFTAPYRAESFLLYVRAGELNGAETTDLESLLARGLKIGVTDQYVYGERLSALRDRPEYADQFVPAGLSEENFERLLAGEIDGLLEDPFVAASTIRRRGLDEQIEAFGSRIHSGDVHLMLSKESVPEATLERLNTSLSEIRADGRHTRVLEKYLE